MISEEELIDLPEEPEQAFVKLVDLLNWKLARLDDQEWADAAHEYVQVISAFADVHQIPLQVDRTYPRDADRLRERRKAGRERQEGGAEGRQDQGRVGGHAVATTCPTARR